MPPEDAPEYRTPGPRALTPRERAFRRWLESEGMAQIIRYVGDAPPDRGNPREGCEWFVGLAEAAFAAGALWAREAGRGDG